jgi:hypothetical protein
LIALRIFDEKPCGLDVSAEAFGYSLKKTHTTVVSYGIRLPRHPLEHAPPASLFLSSQCQSAAGTKIPKSILNPTGTKSTRPPSQDTQHNPPNLSAFGKKARSTTAPRPLSDRAYMASIHQVSSSLLKKILRPSNQLQSWRISPAGGRHRQAERRC